MIIEEKKMKDKILILDVDEVLRNLIQAVLDQYNLKYKTKFVKEDITDYDIKIALTEIHNTIDYFYENAKKCFLYSKPFDDIHNVITKIQKQLGYHIRVTTNQFKQLESYTIEWLNLHNIPYDSLIFTSDKSWVTGDIIVDDNPEFIISSPCKNKILMKRPWNKEYWYKYDSIENIKELPNKIIEIEKRENKK